MITHQAYWLRPVEETDLDWLKELRNHESTWSQLGHFIMLNDVRQRHWFESLSARSDVEYLIFGHHKDRLGLIRLTDIDRINRSACVGGDIHPAHRGKGHAVIMYRLIFRLCFEEWGLHRLWLLVLDTNEVAKHVYTKLGFIEEGKQRQAIFRNGQFIDYLMMSILESEYRK